MKTGRLVGVAAGLCLSLCGLASAVTLTIVHAFSNHTGAGFGMGYDSLAVSGNLLYGATDAGGTYYAGTLYRMNLDGSDFQTIHNLNGGPTPFGITVDGSTIFGTILAGGEYSRGAVYKIQTDGTGYQVLHSFTGTDGDGWQIYSGVTVSGPRLYGTTELGGTNNYGTVFSMAKDGTDYQVIYRFGYGADGARPLGAPIVSGSTVYGESKFTTYAINTDGSGFETLADVGGIGRLTLGGSKLYGTAGASVFSVDMDGTNFELLHSLEGSSQSGLVLCGTTLFGVTRYGGSAKMGTIFSMETDGSNYQVLYEFPGGAGGQEPLTDPILVGSTLYGTAGGGPDSGGIVWSLPVTVVPEAGNLGMLASGAVGMLVRRRK